MIGGPFSLPGAATRCGGWRPALAVVFLDVAQADVTLVKLPSGRSLLVDTGCAVRGTFDVGARLVAPALWASEIRRLDYLAITHADPDHIGGAVSVM